MIELIAKPDLKWVPLKDMYIDESYQRTTSSRASQKNLDWLKENFSWAHCGALIVCQVGKKFAVLDGQHRLSAARSRADIDSLPCIIIQDSNVEQQAKSFVVINTKRVTMNALAKFHAAVAAGEMAAVSVRDILNKAKIEIPRVAVLNGETGPRQMQAIGTLLKMIDRYSEKQIIWVLTIIPEAYGTEKGQLRASLIKALAEYFKRNPTSDRQQMITALQEIEISELEKQARSAMKINGGSVIDSIITAIERQYKSAGRRAK